MAVAVGSITQASRTTGGTNLSFTISHNATGASALLVFYGIEGNRTYDPATATYGGAAMTLLRRYTQANGGTLYLYGLTSPATGTNNVVLTDSSGSNYYDPGVAFVVNLTGTHTTNAFGTVSAGAGLTTSASTSLTTTAANSLVADFAMAVFHPAPTLSSSSPSATVNATHSTYGNLQAKAASRAVSTSGTTATATWTTAYNYVDAVAVEVLDPGVTNYSLTATGLAAGTPSLASPALTQAHSLTASAPSTSAPSLGSPAASTPPPAGFTSGQRLDTSGGTAGYELWGKHDGTNFVFALRAPVGVTTFTTLWLNTDANSSTGHLVFGWAVGAEYNINFYTDGLPYLYSGDAGQTYLGGPLGATFNSDHTEAIVTLPSSSIASPAALEVFVDVNNSVFIPSSYSLYTYTVTAVTLYSLTASGLDAGTPTAGTPALDQTHVLTATGLAPSAPDLATPALTQAHDLTLTGLDAGPTFAASAVLTVVFPDISLTATGLATSAPELGTTGLTQVHVLAPDTFSGSAPALGTPSVSRVFPDISFTAVSPATSAPVLDSPTVTRVFPDISLAATSLATSGGPLLGTSYLTQGHVLTADVLATSAAVLASPDMAQDFVLTATPPGTSAPVLASTALTQDHVLAQIAPATSAPVLASTALTQRHNLTATPPGTAAGTLGSPSVSIVVPDISFTPDALAPSAPALGTPSLSHGYVLAAVAPSLSAPVLAEGSLTQVHALAATPPGTSAPVLGSPAASRVFPDVSLVATPPDTSAPVLGTPVASRVFPDVGLTATPLATSAPVLADADLTVHGALGVLSSDAFTGDNVAFVSGRAPDTGGTWTVRTVNNAGSLILSANKLTVYDAVLATLDDPAPPSADYDVSSDIVISDEVANGVIGRCHPTDPTFYYFRYLTEGQTGSNGTWQLYAFVGGSPTLLAELAEPLTRGITKRLTLRLRGTTISGLVDGVEKVSVTDTAITDAGVAGIRNGGSSGQANWDNFAVEVEGLGADLTASGLDAGAPVLGAPSLFQAQQLIAASLVAGAVILGSPDVSQNYALGTPSALAAGTPSLGTSGLVQSHVIGTTDFSGSVPTLGTSALVQGFSLAPDGTATSAPVADNVTLSQRHVLTASAPALSAPDVGQAGIVIAGLLTPSGVLTATPTFASVSVTQVHVLTASAVNRTAPVIAQASLTQRHVLGTPSGLTGSAHELGTPAASAGAVNRSLTLRNLTTGNPFPDHVALTQDHHLAPASLSTPAPIVGTTDDPANLEDPLGLGEFMIVSLTEAKRHLRIDTDLEDDDVTLKLQAAEAEVMDYINRPGPWVDANNVEVPAPAPVRAATLMVLGDLHANREEGIVGSIHSINPTARRLLARYRNFD